ncbi:MAG: hypothetical protein FJ207_02820 [Gemmatimonadetes bacterium]|nr:hypothetical protein [Gemmatimonadota bacterium]
MRRLRVALLAASFAVLSCQVDEPGPVGPGGVGAPEFAISDAVHGGGNEHFYFLPPLVPATAFGGVSNPSLRPTVVVCEWNVSACGAVVASFDMERGTGSEVVRYDASGQHYVVNWHTDRCVTGPCSLEPSKTYRLRVSVASVQLGYADIDVVSSGRELRNVQTHEYIGLVNGRTLPVKFRIEEGAVLVIPESGGGAPVLPAEGGTVATADGSVVVEIPPGALPVSGEPTVITVEPVEVSSLPEDPNIVPGLTFDFGPDGTVFETPIEVRLAYDPAALPVGMVEEHLRLFTEQDGAWRLLPASHVDLDAKVIVGEVTHFTEIAGGTAPPVVGICIGFGIGEGYSGTIQQCQTDPPQRSLVGEVGGQTDFVAWAYGGAPLAIGEDILFDRTVDVVSSNPGIVRIDYALSPGPQFGEPWALEVGVTFVGLGQASIVFTSESVTETIEIEVVPVGGVGICIGEDGSSGYSGLIQQCLPGWPPISPLRREPGGQTDFVAWAYGAAPENILPDRIVTAVSTDPGVVRIDYALRPGPEFGEPWALEVGVTFVGLGHASIVFVSGLVTETIEIEVGYPPVPPAPTVSWNIVPSPAVALPNPNGASLDPSLYPKCANASNAPQLQVGDTLTLMVEGCDAFGNFTGEAHWIRSFSWQGGWSLQTECGGSPCDEGVVTLLELPWYGAPFVPLVATAPGHTRLALTCDGLVCTSPSPVDIYVIAAP